MSKSQYWHIDGQIARLHGGQLQLRVNLTQPAKGLDEFIYDGQSLANTRLMQLQSQPSDSAAEQTVADVFIRGRDLIATYHQTPRTAVQPQTYWRVLETADRVAGIELIVSVQTTRLDSHPAVRSASSVPAEEVWIMGDFSTESFQAIRLSDEEAASLARDSSTGVFLFRLPDSSVSYVEMIFPNDYQGADLILRDRSTRACQLGYRLFSERLEKGVIRRARIRGLFLPRDQDQKIAAVLYRQFVESQLPLTV